MTAADGLWPLTYLECRERFRRAALANGAELSAHPIEARGPAGEELTVDVARLGHPSPSRALLVTSGVHGIEGYAGSAIQLDLLGHLAASPPAHGIAVVLVHAVNPWGMAWWRRANEHNVDLNRNWFDPTERRPINSAYDEIRAILCPDGPDLPDADAFVAELTRLSTSRGLDWVRHAITGGQYHDPDGLYYGGTEREPSTRLIERIADRELATTEEVLAVDLHTGHGANGTYTLLSRAPRGGDDDRWIRSTFDEDRVETTADPGATSAPKTGQLIPGALAALAPTRWRAITFELGTRSETRMIVAEQAEHWVHRHGDRSDPRHAAAVWQHRVCSIPDDRDWETTALRHGRTVLHRALDGLALR